MSEQPEQWAAEKSHRAWLTANANNHIESGGYSEHAIFDMGWDAAQRAFAEREAELVAGLEEIKSNSEASLCLNCQQNADDARQALAQQDTAALKSREADRG